MCLTNRGKIRAVTKAAVEQQTGVSGHNWRTLESLKSPFEEQVMKEETERQELQKGKGRGRKQMPKGGGPHMREN